MADYQHREYLSVGEVAAHTGLTVRAIHKLVHSGEVMAQKSAGGQYRFRLADIRNLRLSGRQKPATTARSVCVSTNNTAQKIIAADSRQMPDVADNSVHLAITSPPYFNAKMYSEAQAGDLGNVHDLSHWLAEIKKVWQEVFRVLQPGRKFFLNIMNLSVRENKSFRTLNLSGKNIDICEQVGFIFKRDIVWHKTNGVRAHFGTYPYPGGILINHMHEFILEFEKPVTKAAPKYAHVDLPQREASKLSKDFWLTVKNSDVWLMKPEKSGGNREHTAPFPVELPSRLIRAYSFVGETILDPFVGSGATLAAACTHQRNGIGYDINAEFCAMAKRRIEELAGEIYHQPQVAQ